MNTLILQSVLLVFYLQQLNNLQSEENITY